MADSVMDKAREMQRLIEERVSYFESELKALKEAFNDVGVEDYDSVIRRKVQQLMLDISVEYTTIIRTTFLVMRIPYQKSIIDEYKDYLSSLRWCLNIFLNAEKS